MAWEQLDFISLGGPATPRQPQRYQRPSPRHAQRPYQRPVGPPRGRGRVTPGRPGPRALRPPWVPPGRRYSDGVVGLHEEVEDFYQYISPSPEEHQMRASVYDSIRAVILKLWKNAAVFIFGSFETGMYLPTSDIDMVVMGKWRTAPLEMLKDALLKANICQPDSIKVIDKAAVPIIKLTDRFSDVKVDISFNMNNGLVSANQIKQYQSAYPHLPRLVMLLKQMLLQRELNEVFTGGVSSYSLILMAVSFLQTHERPSAVFPGCNLGVLLLEFLEMYGVKFNYAGVCIRVGARGYAPRDQVEHQFSGKSMHNSPLCIEDPNDPTNDIGRSSYNMPKVQEAFRFAYYRLTKGVLTGNGRDESGSLLGTILEIPERTVQYRQWIHQRFPVRPDSPLPDQEVILNDSEQLEPTQGRPLPYADGFRESGGWQHGPVGSPGERSRRGQFEREFISRGRDRRTDRSRRGTPYRRPT